MVNFYNTLLVILSVNCSEFLQHTLNNFDGRFRAFHQGLRSEEIDW